MGVRTFTFRLYCCSTIDCQLCYSNPICYTASVRWIFIWKQNEIYMNIYIVDIPVHFVFRCFNVSLISQNNKFVFNFRSGFFLLVVNVYPMEFYAMIFTSVIKYLFIFSNYFYSRDTIYWIESVTGTHSRVFQPKISTKSKYWIQDSLLLFNCYKLNKIFRF